MAGVVVLALTPVTPTTFYAGTTGFGLSKSTDSGGAWSAVIVAASAIDPQIWARDQSEDLCQNSGAISVS
jgi:hypothetical protein